MGRTPALFDLHCDTLTRSLYCPATAGAGLLDDPAAQLSLSRMPAGTKWVQCFAVFVPDDKRGAEGAAFFDCWAAAFAREMEREKDRVCWCRSAGDLAAAMDAGKFGALLTVEGGSALGGKLERMDTLWGAGVRMMTLTWNGHNELASGHDTGEGFSSFGREAVAAMEERGILVDVSHLNDRGFEELLDIAQKPFVASHSNARSVCAHRRNLPDAFIQEMVRRGGLIGLNYCQNFLSNDGRGDLEDLWRHVERFLELGAEKCLALGSDYDGTDIHSDLDSVEKALGLYDFLIRRGLPEETAEDILFGNAWRFFQAALS